MENNTITFNSDPLLDHYIINLDELEKASIFDNSPTIEVKNKNEIKEPPSEIHNSSFFEHLRKYQNAIGEMGEQYILQEERKKLKNTEYLNRIQHVSKNDSTAGYDIFSFEENGTELFIEVKTSENNDEYFYITQNELIKAVDFKNKGKKYYIYRVLNILSNPSYYIVKDLSDKYSLEPIVWKAMKK